MPINDPLSRWRKKKGKKKRKERFETSNDDYWRGKVAIPERERERKKERKEEATHHDGSESSGRLARLELTCGYIETRANAF